MLVLLTSLPLRPEVPGCPRVPCKNDTNSFQYAWWLKAGSCRELQPKYFGPKLKHERANNSGFKYVCRNIQCVSKYFDF